MTATNKILLSTLCIFLISACKVTKRLEQNCTLDQVTNSMRGSILDAKEFYINTLYLPLLIESLVNYDDDPDIIHTHYARNAKGPLKYAGYHISGYSDTIWAKRTMVKHLLDKYPIQRKDSTYMDTVYSIKVIDESKLMSSQDSCHYVIGLGYTYKNVVVSGYRCISWGVACHYLLPRGMNPNTNSIIGERREGLYNIFCPAYLYRQEGLQAYQDFLRQELGVDMTVERIDTVTVPAYIYKEKE